MDLSMHQGFWIFPGLAFVMGLVLALPFFSKRVEEELEAFLLVMGVLAVSISGLWSLRLVSDALWEPLEITAAVLGAGLAFRWARKSIRRWTGAFARGFGKPALLFVLVSGLGLISSLITAIVAALVLAEVISVLKLPRAFEIKVVVISCFSIGLGAVLTPLGEPLSAIAMAKLKHGPHNADFFFLFVLLAPWVLPALAGLGLWAAFLKIPQTAKKSGLTEDQPESYAGLGLRAGKTFLFVAALVLLGRGFTPLVEGFLINMPGKALYWVNIISAVLDNATLTAAEVTPLMSRETLRYLFLGLLLSGGMLIPGNIPNIICAKKLGITSREWAKAGVPLGLGLMGIYFVLLMVLGG
jgi:predicted cation transporter